MNANRRPLSTRAFTLIELLVATAIFSVLLGALFSILFGVLRLRQTSHRAVELGLPRDHIEAIIRRDLANMVVPAGVMAGTFTGTPATFGDIHEDTLTFYAASGIVNANDPWGDIQSVEYILESPADRDSSLGKDLMRRINRNLLETEIEEPTDTTHWQLVRGVSSFEVLYWDATNLEWTDTWDSTTATNTASSTASSSTSGASTGSSASTADGTIPNANPKAVKIRIDFVTSPDDEHLELPLEFVCEIAPQPRPTPAATTSSTTGGGGGGGQ